MGFFRLLAVGDGLGENDGEIDMEAGKMEKNGENTCFLYSDRVKCMMRVYFTCEQMYFMQK